MTDTAVGIPFLKSPGVDGVDFDLLPRKGLHTTNAVNAAKKYITDTRKRVSEIRVTWLPKLQVPDSDVSNPPHFLVRTQNPSGGVNPFKRAIWASVDVDDITIKVGIYNDDPYPSSLLPEARITILDEKFQYILTGKQLATMLSHNKLVEKIKLK